MVVNFVFGLKVFTFRQKLVGDVCYSVLFSAIAASELLTCFLWLCLLFYNIVK